MTERAHVEPVVIKLFEEKSPPQSWLNENIVKYLQIKSEASFLQDLQAYVRELQKAQLNLLRRGAPLGLKQQIFSFEEGSSAADMTARASYNAMQGLVKWEIEALEQILLTLKTADPSLEARLSPFLMQLRSLAQHFPQLSRSELFSLTEMNEKLMELIKNSPLPIQRLFWKDQLSLLKGLFTQTKAYMQDYAQEMEELKSEALALTSMQDLLQKIQKALRGKLSKESLVHLLEHLQNLANHYPTLGPAEQGAMIAYFEKFKELQTPSAVGVHQLLADTLVQAKIKEYLTENPQATPEQVRNFLEQFLKNSQLQGSPLAFMGGVGDAIEEVIQKKEFPLVKGWSGVAFAQEKEGMLRAHEEVVPAILDKLAPSESIQKGVQEATSLLTFALSEEKEADETKMEAYKHSVEQLKEVQTGVERATLWGANQLYSSGSLPDDFADAIINHYMPGQEQYLRMLAMWLALDNMGAQFGNALLDKIFQFGQAANHYDFNNNLKPADGGDFSGSKSAWQQALDDEKKQAAADAKNAKDAYDQASDQIKKIDEELKDPKYSPEQKQELLDMKSKLQSIQANLKVSIDQINKLQDLLNHLHVNDPQGPNKDNTKYFSISCDTDYPDFKNWRDDLGKFEGTVINGNGATSGPTGGLNILDNDIQHFQKMYSEQGQNQQMILQMRMTEIQQEWTVVSTSLQILNQMYMAVAQAFYK